MKDKVRYIECVTTVSSYSKDNGEFSKITSDEIKMSVWYGNMNPDMKNLAWLLLHNLNLNPFYGAGALEALAHTLVHHLPNLLTVCAPEGEKK